ncbi:Six-bladed beta-propeller [Trema orientale]|uniref:Six-bladed beta-propeller n=1 Tax=Trema orientale TaxID=63057 RepID=A0A2P5FM82_TREOI|nr:Six-bladed beta-propeller [Trema orientale]
MASSVLSSLTLVLLFHFASLHVFATDAVIEEGYTVTTVIDGHKLGINPSFVLLRPWSSDLIVLDSSGSAFYAVPFPVSKDSVIKPFSGTGEFGYVDGEPGSAQFSKPRSFAIDLKGNVYVADKHNNVIRKITDSGVTTIAGVYQKTGRKDGPVQNATFSNDFELVFVPEICALLVSDHGSQLVRQIDLKAEDCRKGSEPGSGSGVAAVSIWSVAVGVACIVGFAVGLAARPYIFPYEGIRMHRFSETWKLCLINLEKQIQIPCFAIRSAIASSSLVCSLLERLFWLSLSHLSLIFRNDYLVPQVSPKEHLSLLDYDKVDGSSCSNSSSSSEIMKSQKYANQLKDLISFDESLELSNLAATEMFQQREEYLERQDVVLSDCYGNGKIENMIETNIMHFAEVTKETTLIDGTLFGSSGLVKRR